MKSSKLPPSICIALVRMVPFAIPPFVPPLAYPARSDEVTAETHGWQLRDHLAERQKKLEQWKPYLFKGAPHPGRKKRKKKK